MIELQINPQSSQFVRLDDPPIYNENGLNGEHDEVLQVHHLGVEYTGINQQVEYVGQQYIEPFIIVEEAILCEKKDIKRLYTIALNIVNNCIEEHNDAHGSEVNNLFEVDCMPYIDVKIFLFLPKAIITNYVQSKLRNGKQRLESDIAYFLKDVADYSTEHIIPTKGSIEHEPSYIENSFFGADQEHIFFLYF